MHKFCFYVPSSHLGIVKQGLFDLGLGRQDNYEHCCWQERGQMQFRPLPGSTPHIGKAGELQRIEEYKVEMLCEDSLVSEAVKILKQLHPYQQPAYECWPIRLL